MTKAEKRYLQLHIKMYNQDKDYQFLYRILQKDNSRAENVKASFLRQRPKANFDICCHHLYKLIIQRLIVYEAEKDIENQLSRKFQECKLLFERGLYVEFFKLNEKCKSLALKHEKFDHYCLFARLELKYLNQLEFPGLNESGLVKKQNKLESVFRQQRAIDNHYALYNLIRFRQYHLGPTRSEAEKEKLKGLAFNELQANMSLSKDSFEAQKIHLLFQSSYFMMTANPKSSLKVSYELNCLFESNKGLGTSSSLHYIELLSIILRNLRIFGQYNEIPYFIERLQEIIKADPSAERTGNCLVFLYESYSYTDQGKFSEALSHLEQSAERMTKSQSGISAADVVLQVALVKYLNGQLREAIKELRKVLDLGKSVQQMAVYPSIRLLMNIIRFDLKDYEYLTYEIRSFERELKKIGFSKQSEQLAVGMIKKLVNLNDKDKAKSIVQKAYEQLLNLMKNPNESLRIKSLNLFRWIESIRV